MSTRMLLIVLVSLPLLGALLPCQPPEYFTLVLQQIDRLVDVLLAAIRINRGGTAL